MKKTIKVLMAIVIVFAVALTGCKKEPGPKGDKGDPGKDGVANISTSTLTVNSWTWDNTTKTRDAFFTTVSVLTQNVVDKGMVMVYEDIGSSSYVPLPETYSLGSGITYHNTFSIAPNFVYINVFRSDDLDPNPPPAKYKLVVIPPALVKKGVNYYDYAEVKKAHNLQD